MRKMRLQAFVIAAVLLAWSVPFELARAEVPSEPGDFSNPLTIDNKYHPFEEYRIRVYEVQQGHTELTVIDVFTSDTRTFEFDVGEGTATFKETTAEDAEPGVHTLVPECPTDP